MDLDGRVCVPTELIIRLIWAHQGHVVGDKLMADLTPRYLFAPEHRVRDLVAEVCRTSVVC